MSRKLIGVVNVQTGVTREAPSHCPFCGGELGEMIRHVVGTSFEATCEREGCGKTFIVMNDSVKM